MAQLNVDSPQAITFEHDRATHIHWFAWVVWGLGAALFFSEYIARISPSVMLPYLMRDFHVNAFTLGSLSAFFYYPYVVMQVPVGMLVDRFGPSRLLLLTSVLFALSCFLFATSNYVGMAELSRFLMGFSASFAFVSTLKLAISWFPARHFGLLAGFTQALGMLGAAVGDAPMSLLVENVGWRSSMDIIAIVFLVLGIFIWLLVSDTPKNFRKRDEVPEVSRNRMLSGLAIVIRNPQSWLNGAYAGLVFAVTGALGELWGPAFLHDSYGISRSTAAMGIGMHFIGFAIGGPIVGWFSDSIGKRRPVMLASAILCAVILSIILYSPGLPLGLLYCLLFMLGVANTGVAISYALSSEINPHHTVGTSLAFANMSSVIIGALLQPIIGLVLDFSWDGKMVEGIRIYSAGDYRTALTVLPVCLILAIGALFFIKETNCRPLESRTSR